MNSNHIRKLSHSICQQCTQNKVSHVSGVVSSVSNWNYHKKFYSKLTVRERKLLEKQIEKQEKGLIVQGFINKYFSSSTTSSVMNENLSTTNTSSNNSQSDLPIQLSVEKYKRQSQIEKILQLELTRKRNSANPRAVNSPGRMNAMILQQDIDKSLYSEYSRKCFQHGFDVFIAKLRKESQANLKTKQVFSFDQQKLSAEVEERLSILVADREQHRHSSHIVDPLEENDTIELIEKITQNRTDMHGNNKQSNQVCITNESYKLENKNHPSQSTPIPFDSISEEDLYFASPNSLNQVFQKLSNRKQSQSTFEENVEDDSTDYLEVSHTFAQNQQKESVDNEATSTHENEFRKSFMQSQSDTMTFARYMPREKWFDDDIDDDFETLEYAYEDGFENRITMQL